MSQEDSVNLEQTLEALTGQISSMERRMTPLQQEVEKLVNRIAQLEKIALMRHQAGLDFKQSHEKLLEDSEQVTTLLPELLRNSGRAIEDGEQLASSLGKLTNLLTALPSSRDKLQEILEILQRQTNSEELRKSSEDLQEVNEQFNSIQGTLKGIIDISKQRNEITEDQIRQIVDNSIGELGQDLDEKISETREINIQESKNQKQQLSKMFSISIIAQSLFFLVALVVAGTWIGNHLTGETTNPRPQQSSPSLVD